MIKACYIHIPFCERICSYCDFCKVYYDNKWVNDYLTSLELEIKDKYQGDVLDTIYIGGGTPTCLKIEELKRLFDIIKMFKVSDNLEFTIEGNIESIDEEKLKLFKNNYVNRLSIGVESFHPKHLELLNRRHSTKETIDALTLIKKMGFKNINIDLIYAIPNQTIDELKEDLNLFLKLDLPHLSVYSLIIEEHTKLYLDKVDNIDEDLDYEMYQTINQILTNHGYHQYEISNYAKDNYESKHNLTYWNNEEYYGFGLGASGYLGGVRYTNTRSISNYLKGNYVNEKIQLTKDEMVENALILGLRKIKGIKIENFEQKYGIKMMEDKVIKELIKEEKLISNNGYIYINSKYIYLSNEILVRLMK
ncbi:MAG: radical SAM family heme chaperone HemW [Bacilli bacterium]|nr:radical SAM family heme chaperone HemW [Bacilli bacterium]MDD4808582.1 radical SAM family heme chaperone HemW [Bacilli bacterium]